MPTKIQTYDIQLADTLDKVKLQLQEDSLVTIIESTSIALYVDDQACEPITLMYKLNLEPLLQAVREENPALYMKGVTSDMLIKYT